MSYKSIVVLTGAGISAESGLKTFRGADGLWEGHRVEDVATPEAFARNPKLVHQFYNQRRQQLIHSGVKPNAAHEALADFEKRFDGEFLLVTQNIDNLHEQAGSKKLLHMHGELLKARCLGTGSVTEVLEDLSHEGSLRPHIVWFGEMPMYMDEIYSALHRCDLFVSIGTSGNVYPAAGFVGATPRHARRVEINLEDTMISDAFDEHHIGMASVKVPEFFSAIRYSSP